MKFFKKLIQILTDWDWNWNKKSKFWGKLIQITVEWQPPPFDFFQSRTWYKEALILAIIVPLIGFTIQFFIPIPLSLVLYYILLSTAIIWRIRKKALSRKEAIVIIIVSTIFIARYAGLLEGRYWPFPILVSILFTFLIIWGLHKITVKK